MANDYGITSTIDATVDAAENLSVGGNCKWSREPRGRRDLPARPEDVDQPLSIGYICPSSPDVPVTRRSTLRA
jgi:hypothetical protein